MFFKLQVKFFVQKIFPHLKLVFLLQKIVLIFKNFKIIIMWLIAYECKKTKIWQIINSLIPNNIHLFCLFLFQIFSWKRINKKYGKIISTKHSTGNLKNSNSCFKEINSLVFFNFFKTNWSNWSFSSHAQNFSNQQQKNEMLFKFSKECFFIF